MFAKVLRYFAGRYVQCAQGSYTVNPRKAIAFIITISIISQSSCKNSTDVGAGVVVLPASKSNLIANYSFETIYGPSFSGWTASDTSLIQPVLGAPIGGGSWSLQVRDGSGALTAVPLPLGTHSYLL